MVDQDHPESESGDVPDLQKLISDHRDLHGGSYRTMADTADKAGFKIKFQTINDLATKGPKSWPKEPDTIRALAAATETTERAIVLAYAKSLGIDVEAGSAFADMMPAGTDRLDPQLRDALLMVVRAAVRGPNEDTGTTQGSTTSSGEGSVPDSGRAPIVGEQPLAAVSNIRKGTTGRGTPPYIDRAPGVDRSKWAANSTAGESMGAKLDRLDAEHTDALIRDEESVDDEFFDEGPEGGA